MVAPHRWRQAFVMQCMKAEKWLGSWLAVQQPVNPVKPGVKEQDRHCLEKRACPPVQREGRYGPAFHLHKQTA